MSAYNLFPGLKQILEDKRIRRFGVPEAEYQNYLRAEQFVIDMRGYTEEEWKDVVLTYEDLKSLNLNAPPYESFVLHVVAPNQNMDERIFSVFSAREDAFFIIYESENSLRAHKKAIHDEKNYKQEVEDYLQLVMSRLIVLLATRGVDKSAHKMPSSRFMTAENGTHKKGVGGYTIIGRPHAVTSPDGDPCRRIRAHFRRGHIRKYAPEDKTRWVYVQSCFVNGEPEVQRKAYLVAV